MEITYDEKLDCPVYKLTREETSKLESTGFIQDDEKGIVITKVDGQYTSAKLSKGRESIILNY